MTATLLRSLAPLFVFSFLASAKILSARPITVNGEPAVVSIRAAGSGSLRITIKPESFDPEFPHSPVLPERRYPRPALSLREITRPVKARVGELQVEVQSEPLRIRIKAEGGRLIQSLTFQDDGSVEFVLDDHPVLGLGEGGPRPQRGVNWRTAPVEFDRRGRLHRMEPRWQSDAYGSRNPVALMIGTGGWGIYFNNPWGQIDLTQSGTGRFIPVQAQDPVTMRQSHGNQSRQLGKGVPPMDQFVPGLLDIFVFDTRNPRVFMKDLATISGPAVMPPKWALGYMQSHRTLEDDTQLTRIVDTFREKKIPLDAVIYLGTGFTPRGWNTKQPSFGFNPEVFKREPAEVISRLHERHVKVAVHIVPWDRDRLV
jgi:alpha-glucosidase/alpha-D-xyloside xylohydrolase